MEGNLRRLFGMQICVGCQFFLPVFFLFLRENGLSWQEIFGLEAIFTLSIMVFQIPAGMVADWIGCKTVLVVGFVAGLSSFLIHAHSSTFAWFACGDVLLALFVACYAAGLETMTYATLTELGRSADYRRVIGNLMFASLAVLALSSVIGGLIAMISLRLTLWLTVPAFGIGALLAAGLMQPEKVRGTHVSFREAVSSICEDGWALRTVMMVNITFLTAVTMLGWLSQPYQVSVGVPEWVMGLVQALSLLLASLTALGTHRLEKRLDDRVLLAVAMGVVALTLVGMTVFGGWVGIILLILGRACTGAVTTLGSDLLHRLIDDRVRSRVQALQGALMRGTMALATLGIGSVMEGGGIGHVLPLAAAVATVTMAATLGCLSAAWPTDPLP